MSKDAKYSHIHQKPFCCVPACLQMVMTSRELKDLDQEVIGIALGLVVPPDFSNSFSNKVETSSDPPTSGYGTRVQIKGYDLNSGFEKLDIPLKAKITNIDEIQSESSFKELLVNNSTNNIDSLICLDAGSLDDIDESYGHVVLVDSLKNNSIIFIDPDYEKSLREVSLERLYKSMKKHGSENMAGVWSISS